ncbi:zinc-dependent alcohol dehydrogenase family protein [Pseudonocardia eucalypti]|uniref:Zinc-dependent alcohol dehydrogenase family protein n=1 Tax=Pseudonocardia eucalypti TaxID=648755 RepID=A0ABP9RBG5_9PSEU
MPRAAVCTALGQPLRVMDLDLAEPRAGEVRVRLGAAGICASDASVRSGDLVSPLPVVLGHEGAGTVVSVGEGVTDPRPGDHVVVTGMPQCGSCYRCARGQPSLCEVGDVVLRSGALRDGTHRFGAPDGTPVAQMVAAGTFAEEVVVSAISTVRIPGEVAFAPASLIGCGVLTGFGAAMNAAAIRPGYTVAVIGCGSVGLAALQGARLAGAAQILAIDLVAGKLELAGTLGATDVIPAGEAADVVAEVRARTGRRGVDVAIECVGAQATVDQAIAMTAKGGEVVFVGAGGPGVRVDVPQFSGLVGRAKTFRGVLFGAADNRRDVPRIVRAYQDGDLELDRLVTHRFGLDEINEGLASLGRGDVVSAVVELS